MALMSLRSRSHVKASMVLTRADHLFTQLYTITLIYMYGARGGVGRYNLALAITAGTP